MELVEEAIAEAWSGDRSALPFYVLRKWLSAITAKHYVVWKRLARNYVYSYCTVGQSMDA